MLFSPGARVKVSKHFSQSKLDVLGLLVGSKGTVKFTMRTRKDIPGIAVVDWDAGFRGNANEDHLDKE